MSGGAVPLVSKTLILTNTSSWVRLQSCHCNYANRFMNVGVGCVVGVRGCHGLGVVAWTLAALVCARCCHGWAVAQLSWNNFCSLSSMLLKGTLYEMIRSSGRWPKGLRGPGGQQDMALCWAGNGMLRVGLGRFVWMAVVVASCLDRAKLVMVKLSIDLWNGCPNVCITVPRVSVAQLGQGAMCLARNQNGPSIPATPLSSAAGCSTAGSTRMHTNAHTQLQTDKKTASTCKPTTRN